MTFGDILVQVLELLKRQGRVSYSALKRRFDLDDDYLNDLKDEILFTSPQIVDEGGRGLVWVGEQAASAQPSVSGTPALTSAPATDQEREPLSYTPQHLAEKILTSRSALEGERKQVTVLFCDLANSTPIAERLGPEHMHTLLNRFFELALSEVHQYEGTINQFLGDEFMALFGAPLAHKDHARRAVLAALALQHTLQEVDLGKPFGEACQFRMGLNSELVVVGSIGDNLRMDYSAIGDTTNLASRLQDHAAPGDILISESFSRLVQGTVRLEALPPVQVKGKMELIPLYKVGGTLPRRSPIASRSERTLSPFVGRERELATLEGLFAQVEAGQGQVIGIVAEAGGGKSRLLYEFRQRLQDKRVTYLEGRCLSYGSTIPYHPLIEVLRHNCGISETESPEAIIEKVRCALQEVGMDAEESAPYLLQLLGVQHGTERLAPLTPEAIRTRTFDTLKQMSLQGSQQRSLVFEIEDLHWIDKTSEEYYESLLTTRRQTLHAAAGQALEALYVERLEEVYDRLAYHYAHTDQAAKAVEYLTLVATKAVRNYAYAEAVSSLQEALQHAEQLAVAQRDHQVLDLVIRQGESLFWSGRRQELVTLFLHYQDRLERLQTPVLTGRYYYWLAMAYIFLGQRDDAAQCVQRALEAGHSLRGVAHAQRAVALLEASTDHFPRGSAYYALGLTLGYLGHFPAALAAATEMVAIGRASSDRRLQSEAAALREWISAQYGEWQTGLAACQQALEDVPDAYETALTLEFLDYIYLEQGEVIQALPVLESAVQAAQQYRSQQVQIWFNVYLGEAYQMNYQLEQAQDLTMQGYELARRIKHPWGIGLAQRTLGRITHTSGNLAKAARHLQDARATFDAIPARYNLARTHLDLVSLAYDQGNQDTATTHLSTAHAWFQKLQVPKWVERTEQLAREYGVILAEVALEEVREGET